MSDKWRWDGIDLSTGRARSGRVDAESETAARAAAHSAGVVPVNVRRARSLLGDMNLRDAAGGRAKPVERAQLYRTLALAAATGKPMPEAFEDAKAGLRRRSRLRVGLERMIYQLDAGKKPVDVLKAESHLLGSEAAAVYEAATRTDIPEQALLELSEITEQSGEIAARVRSAMVKPVMNIGIAVLVAVVMMIFVMPTVASTFEEFGGELPPTTRLVVGASEFLGANFASVAAAAVMVTICAGVAMQRPNVRISVSRFAHKLPITGRVLTAMGTQRVCALMGVMLTADVTHEDALRICGEAVSAPSVSVALHAAAEDVHDKRLHEAVAAHLTELDPSLEALAKQSVSGMPDPGANWSRYGTFLRRDTTRRVSGLTDALDPILVVVVGAMVGVMVFAFYEPMFSVFNVVVESTGI